MKWCPKYMGSEISDDYAYLLGALRDACVYLPEYELKFVQKNFSWLSDVVRPKLMRTFDIGRMSVRKRGDGLYELKLNSKKVVSKLIEDAGVNKRPIDTPPIILNQPLPKLAWYVAGFYDAEGDKSGSRFRFWQSWTSEDECPPLQFISYVLRCLGIMTKYYRLGMRRGKMYEFCLEVCRSPTTNLIKFLNFIPLQHPETVLRAPREFRRA
jgi:hypothetical protein